MTAKIFDQTIELSFQAMEPGAVLCSRCEGRGFVRKMSCARLRCSDCNGTGVVQDDEPTLDDDELWIDKYIERLRDKLA